MKFVLIAMFFTAPQGFEGLPAHTVTQEYKTLALCNAAKTEMENVGFSAGPAVPYLGGKQMGTASFVTCSRIRPE